MVRTVEVDSSDMFTSLRDGVAFESVCTGRKGAVLLAHTPDGSAPMVRSTTKYERAHQRFRSAHAGLSSDIALAFAMPSLVFNNALVEEYTWQYRTMGMHCDQALDLVDDSFICLFSCYSNPEDPDCDVRQLVIRDKVSSKELIVQLAHCSAVLFSVADNARFVHQIVPTVRECCGRSTTWLGVTFRCSKRAVMYVGGKAYLETGRELLLLRTRALAVEFYKQRRLENGALAKFEYDKEAEHVTVSPSDMFPPVIL